MPNRVRLADGAAGRGVGVSGLLGAVDHDVVLLDRTGDLCMDRDEPGTWVRAGDVLPVSPYDRRSDRKRT